MKHFGKGFKHRHRPTGIFGNKHEHHLSPPIKHFSGYSQSGYITPVPIHGKVIQNNSFNDGNLITGSNHHKKHHHHHKKNKAGKVFKSIGKGSLKAGKGVFHHMSKTSDKLLDIGGDTLKSLTSPTMLIVIGIVGVVILTKS